MNKNILGLAALLSLSLAAHAQAAEVSGFRSARFGANEKAVTEAAVKDLGIKAGDLVRNQDASAHVTTLTAKLQTFAPLNLPATITYVLGYKCNCLTQASIMWTFPDAAVLEQRKTAISGIGALVSHFAEQGWGKDEVITNRVPGEVKEGSENAIVFFRGQNKAGSAITLLGSPVKMMKPSKAAEKEAKSDSLAANIDEIKRVSLSYEKDAANPDILRVDVSGF